MPAILGTLRRLILAPSLDEVTFARRGFPGPRTKDTGRLEAIPAAVVCGFEWAVETPRIREIERRLELVDTDMRGFAYEGAAMALTILDATSGGHRTRDLLSGPGAPHLLLSYIGVGFAMARLPRPLWRRVLPDLTDSSPYHPTMSWLVVDGYGFDLAYFHQKRWVERQQVPAAYPWQGAPDYFPRAVDQGIGRALWFIHSGRTRDVAAAVARFATTRHADLWSGVGLAAAFAGGSTPTALAELRTQAGPHGLELGLGAVFATQARSMAGAVPPHTHPALTAFAGVTAPEALRIVRTTAGVDPTSATPAYEAWRQRIRDRLAATNAAGTAQTDGSGAHPPPSDVPAPRAVADDEPPDSSS
ncbi:hypothetical protein FHR81_001913 [Actinoalloteichus hoggarensis]|uniref:Uncharacterized protein n=1 Tax=Actinoalloteichus hoggarensis TaxID=1470176 RepID=A0A221W5G9_9PSEU|nr:DUF1702 family protein [Actinoalloteichus hoggarensis]ASO20944.1 hypothetical protein AHOG_16590 [Actinoalloteichus hoggarensis]MBB5920875.1 hypothetical protein [Actinoalloteichus hoggarensis]